MESSNTKSAIGMIGLAVMGENLALNIARNGFQISVFNRDTTKVDKFLARASELNEREKVTGTYSLEEFVNSLSLPRKIILLVKAGSPVDDVLAQLKPLLSAGDIVIDGGNSFFRDTQRREKEIRAAGFHYIGSGVSGGESGALWGPSLMPGGAKEAYDEIKPIWEAIAAKVDDGPCVTYIGTDGAGHFVKMIHNGIEYGDMQLIAEAYDILRSALNLTADELHEIFAEWNKGMLNSFLIEITERIFTVKDPETGKALVDLVLDKAGQKGTGKWTSQVALELGVVIPTIQAAVDSRILSSMKDERVSASKELTGPSGVAYTGDRQALIDAVRDALYASKICSYAQGMNLIRAQAAVEGWDLDLGEISRIWKGGCIIRAQFLDKIKQAYRRRPDLPNLLLDQDFKTWVLDAQPRWRVAVGTAISLGISVPAMSASLAYFDSYRTANLPQNLTQAQRDYFGSHTYQRTDRPEAGFVHTEWESISARN